MTHGNKGTEPQILSLIQNLSFPSELQSDLVTMLNFHWLVIYFNILDSLVEASPLCM